MYSNSRWFTAGGQVSLYVSRASMPSQPALCVWYRVSSEIDHGHRAGVYAHSGSQWENINKRGLRLARCWPESKQRQSESIVIFFIFAHVLRRDEMGRMNSKDGQKMALIYSTRSKGGKEQVDKVIGRNHCEESKSDSCHYIPYSVACHHPSLLFLFSCFKDHQIQVLSINVLRISPRECSYSLARDLFPGHIVLPGLYWFDWPVPESKAIHCVTLLL